MKTFLIILATGLMGSSWATECKIDPERELLITHASVIDDKRTTELGPWSFGGLVQKLAGTTPAPVYVERWLNQWRVPALNGFPLKVRPPETLELFWDRDANGSLNLAASPFQLLAIVNRTDLANPEGRFVFGAFDPWTGNDLPFTLIFEFHLPFTDEFPDVVAWTKAFHQLSQLPHGEAYNQRLQYLTDVFSRHLAQVRTNDFLLDTEWELREFRHDDRGSLNAAPTGQTPDNIFLTERRDELVRWATDHASEVEKETFTLPPGFLAPSALAPNEGFRWLRGAGLPETLRHPLSLATCNGCHTGETRTRFTHIFPRRAGNATEISGFLRGELVRRKALAEARLCQTSGPRKFPSYLKVH